LLVQKYGLKTIATNDVRLQWTTGVGDLMNHAQNLLHDGQ
jgi:hypothetical protein